MNDFNIQDYINKETINDYLSKSYMWLDENVFSFVVLYQLGIIAVVFLLAITFSKKLKGFLEKEGGRSKIFNALAPFSLFLIWLPLQWIAIITAETMGLSFHAIRIVASLLSAWVVIRLVTGIIHNKALAKILSVTIWLFAALNIVGVLNEAVTVTDQLAFSFGDVRISALGIIKSFISLAVLLSIASTLSKTLESRISKFPNITPSAQVLFGKLLKMIFFAVAIMVALEALGIDLTAFAVFGGALGVGIGFGLQKVISNFVSGIILLLERSLKPGDVIAVGNTYGWVQSLGARYVSLVTRDGTEHLIPNEEFITQRVENWSYSDNNVRLSVPVGISYNADLDLAIQLCLDAAASIPRVLKDPPPKCLISGFGDSSVDLSVRFWICDPAEGRSNVMSDIYYAVWKKFHEHNIEIPFPQRDLHIKSPDFLRIIQENKGS